jgi:hypothetical protein
VIRDITRINCTAPEPEGIRLRKVEAAARGFDLGQGDVSVLENCRLPHLLVGQHGASQAWPLPQKPIALALPSTFPRNGVPDPNEDEFYEAVEAIVNCTCPLSISIVAAAAPR